MTLMERLLKSGYPREEMFHHGSALYVYATALADRVIRDWCEDEGYTRSLFCTTFRDQVTGRVMFDIAFAYDPYWSALAKATACAFAK